MRGPGEQLAGQLREARLVHPRLGRDGGDQPPHQLDVAVDVALQLRPDQADLIQNVRAQPLLVEAAVLVLGEQAGDHDDKQRERDRHVRRSTYQAQHVAQGVEHGSQDYTASGRSAQKTVGR